MAMVFELVANSDSDELSAQLFLQNIAKRLTDVRVRDYCIKIHQPVSDRVDDKNTQAIVVSIIPKNVGYGVGLDQDRYRIPPANARHQRFFYHQRLVRVRFIPAVRRQTPRIEVVIK
jgi:hypothetical protein